MKQVQFTFQDNKKLEEELRKLRQWARSNFCSKVLVQICTEIPDRERIEHVCETIERLMPEALYAGCYGRTALGQGCGASCDDTRHVDDNTL